MTLFRLHHLNFLNNFSPQISVENKLTRLFIAVCTFIAYFYPFDFCTLINVF